MRTVDDVDATGPQRAEPGARSESGADDVFTDGQTPAQAVPPEPVTDPALAALADARAIARGPTGRFAPRRGSPAGRRTRRDNLAGRNRGGYSAPGPDSTSDPQRIGSVLTGYVAERGWARPLAEARIFAEWAALVGADVAAHSAPQSLTDGELRIAAESSAWATQLRLLGSTLLARLVAELGPDVVGKLHISGPVGPSWKHGRRAVPGARGPRDTYG